VSVRFVDCRFGAGRAEGGHEEYLAAHLPGAAYADTERDLTGPQGDGRHPLPSAEAFAAWASAAGIGPGTLVVAYDQGTGWADRLWWLLRHFGHDACATIPFAAWRGPPASGEERIGPGAFVSRPRDDDTISAEEILERLDDPRLVLYDARSPERWRGEIEPLDPVAGRIPGARNAFYLEPLPAAALAAGELVFYCGSGVSACPPLHAAVLAGRGDARLYPGSWSDWCSRGLPVEKGEP